MIVDPYVRNPDPPTVALLTADGRIVSEYGELVDPDDWPDGLRCWTDYDTARSLVAEGRGEALCWNGEEIRWRHERFEDGWKRRPSDVAVLRAPFPEHQVATLKALAAWRDWLASYGASPSGTSGAAAWSLLRATLAKRLWCSQGNAPPLYQTMGGRMALGPGGPGHYEGPLEQVDLQAAYARTLAGLSYGGWWMSNTDLGLEPDAAAATAMLTPGHDRPVFVRATVRVPGLPYGLLLRRPRVRMSQLELHLSQLYMERFPTRCTLTGVWTLEEVQAAARFGCTVRPLQFWVHVADGKPFTAWWAAIEQGRTMPGLAGTLAKMTGNALWGRFCMDTSAAGERTIRSMNGKMTVRPLTARGGVRPAHDLAETVSGRVRALLGALMIMEGDRLVSAHTDGAWLKGGDNENDDRSGEHARMGPRRGMAAASTGGVERGAATDRGPVPGAGSSDEGDRWRLKARARSGDWIDPQTLRYYPIPAWPDGLPVVIFAGHPRGEAREAFETAWQARGAA